MASEAHDLEPAFQTPDGENIVEQPPISKLAILSCLLGIVSLVALLAPPAAVVSVLAIVIGLLAAFLGSASSRMTHIGIGLGALTAVWPTVSMNQKNQYVYQEAGKAAEHFLELLASGKKYEAIELSEMEMDRQITGTDLSKYYGSKEGEDRDRLEEFLHDPLNIAVMESGPDSEWKYTKGIRVRRERGAYEIVVECRDQTTPTSPVIYVRLQRSLNMMVGDDSVALWNVLDVVAPGDLE